MCDRFAGVIFLSFLMAILFVSGFGLLACSDMGAGQVGVEANAVNAGVDGSKKSDEAQVEKVVKKAELGPVSAEVRFWPAEPVLGDRVHLVLEVNSAPGVDVTMPAFGELLGRFEIASYQPLREVREDGSVFQSQRYVLDLPMSGKQRLPSMLIDFVDRRTEVLAKHPQGLRQELLTPAFTVKVASLRVDEELSAVLRPAKGELLPHPKTADEGRAEALPVLIILVVILIGCLLIFMFWWRRRRQVVPTPYELAIEALSKLSLPPQGANEEELDRWTVVLSGIIRRYIEGAYALTAPKLTTEEFIEIASSSAFFDADEQRTLREILQGADRIKFTTYVPDSGEAAALRQSVEDFIQRSHEVLMAQSQSDVAQGGK